ncbi:transcription factor iiib subunit [Rhizobium leguminosarum]|uniref:transcription factor iiib subunit n=1 Tax=Rhizobium leguminosarum TaxID=384 RepID=UPI001039737A|nr:transcription factor iiib subunit [Rhizobium leguminosarum]TBZ75891.1 transcription factor iiib subunit [Rhizobium leguminosarum bv. viciae]
MTQKAALATRNVKRLLQAVRDAGFPRARMIAHLDGRTEIIGESEREDAVIAAEQASPFLDWKTDHANKD